MKLQTNVDLINDLMHNSPHPMVCQTFLLTAIKEYCMYVLKNKSALIDNEEDAQVSGVLPLFQAQVWVDVADDINDKVRKFYDR